MSQAPFEGDRIELLCDFIGLPDNGNAVFALNFVGNYRWGDENADSRLAESLHRGHYRQTPPPPVAAAAGDPTNALKGPRTAASLPGISKGADVERDNLAMVCFSRAASPGFGKKCYATVAELMAIAFYICPCGHRTVGQNHIKTLDRQLHCETHKFIFAANQANRFGKRHRRA